MDLPKLHQTSCEGSQRILPEAESRANRGDRLNWRFCCQADKFRKRDPILIGSHEGAICQSALLAANLPTENATYPVDKYPRNRQTQRRQ